MNAAATLDRLDRFQRERSWAAIPFAIVKRSGESNTGSLAATIAYYGFFSLFPLLLVLTSIGGYVLQDRPDLQDQLLGSALAQFPVVGPEIRQNVTTIQGSGVAVAVGLVLAIWAGLGVVRVAQRAMDIVWDVPRKQRPRFPRSTGIALLSLVVLAAFVVTASVVTWLSARTGGVVGTTAGMVGPLALNIGFFALGYRVLTTADVTWRQVAPGAVIAATGWTALLALGGWLVSSRISSSAHVYGTFAVVIGLLGWIYLGTQIALLGAVTNVVLANRLWPRSLRGGSTPADREALRRSARREELVAPETVDVTFGDGAG